MVVPKTNWDGVLEITYNSCLSVNNLDKLFVGFYSFGWWNGCYLCGVSICVADNFLVHKLLRIRFIFTRKIQTCVVNFTHLSLPKDKTYLKIKNVSRDNNEGGAAKIKAHFYCHFVCRSNQLAHF